MIGLDNLQPPNLPPADDNHMDNPNISEDLMAGIRGGIGGGGGGVNCYPGHPSKHCYDQAYIHVDYVEFPWESWRQQMKNCPNTKQIIFVGSRYALYYHKITNRARPGKRGRPGKQPTLTSKFKNRREGMRVSGKDMAVISYHDGVLH